MDKVLVGIRPTGRLHIGHYFSVIQPAVQYKADILLANLHAPNAGNSQMRTELHTELSKYIPVERIKIQSEHFKPWLYFQLLEQTPSGLLRHMPQYKAKEKNALMFTYPVLMAHDVADYDIVIVGDDQRPHAELAADLLPRVGRKVPDFQYDGGRIMDLRHPERKMSKSEPAGCLFLRDENAEQKINRAVTNEAGVANLWNIYYRLGGTDEQRDVITGHKELKQHIYLLYGAAGLKAVP